MKATSAHKKSLLVYIITLSLLLQSCFSYKPTSKNSYVVNRNGVQTVIVNKPQIKTTASAFSWISSIALVPVYGVGLIPVIYCASSGSKTDVESDEDAQKWVKLYNKKYKTNYMFVPTDIFVNKKSSNTSNWVNVKDYSVMSLISKDAASMYYAQTPEDVTNYGKMFPGSENADGFVKRTGTSANEPTLYRLISNYPNNSQIGEAKKRYILMSKNYNEFNLRLAQFNSKNINLTKEEILKHASSLILNLPEYKDLIDFKNRYGVGTIYDDALFEKIAQFSFPYQLETLINTYPNSKYRESAISLLIYKTEDLNTLKRYAGVYTNSKHNEAIVCKIQKKEGYNNAKEYAFKLSGDKAKSYPTTRVGNYYIMSENLDVTHFRNGDAIKRIETDEEWVRAYKNETPAYCDHPMGSSYGKIYNRYAFDDTRELAPEGWRRPTVDEWNTIIKEMAKKQLEAFYYLKEGYKQRNGEFSKFEDGALFWCSSETELVDKVLPLYYFVLFENNNYISKLVVKYPYYSELLGKLNARVEANYRFKDKNGVYPSSKGDGMSVRLIKE